MTDTTDTIVLPSVIETDSPFVAGERESLTIPDILSPVEWAEENFILTAGAGYASTGKLVLYPWQREIVRSILNYDRLLLCGPVQTGKSLMAEVMFFYVICTYNLHGIICYAKRETIENVFQDRIKPTIEGVPCLRKMWDGNPDNLTKDKIKLRNAIIRVASAQVKADIATFSAGLIYASEVCKYKKAQAEAKLGNFDLIKLLQGRQQAYSISGIKKEILESSPLEPGDVLHREMFKTGVTNLVPYYPCPTCGHYQTLELIQIKEIPNSNKEMDHNPERIRQDRAAYYECIHCGNNIPEDKRIEIGERVVWATKDEKINQDGTLTTTRNKTTAISFQWNRLVDYSFTFSECLARFFEANRSGDPITLRDYFNEDMGEFKSVTVQERSTSWLMKKICNDENGCKFSPYKIADPIIPDAVEIILCGIDTQDNGFWWVTRGYGRCMETFLLDCGFMTIPMGQGEFADPEKVYSKFCEYLFRKKFHKKDLSELEIHGGFLDRGGHRSLYVDYLVSKMPGLCACFGSTNRYHPLIKHNTSSGLYEVNTENLSRCVAKQAEGDNWHLPEDVPKDYLMQFVRQYEQEYTDRHGNKTKKWVDGGDDHLRDAENYCYGFAVEIGLDAAMFDSTYNTNTNSNQDSNNQSNDNDPVNRTSITNDNNNGYFSDIQARFRGRRR